MVTQPSKRASRLSTANIQASVLASVAAIVMFAIVPDFGSYY